MKIEMTLFLFLISPYLSLYWGGWCYFFWGGGGSFVLSFHVIIFTVCWVLCFKPLINAFIWITSLNSHKMPMRNIFLFYSLWKKGHWGLEKFSNFTKFMLLMDKLISEAEIYDPRVIIVKYERNSTYMWVVKTWLVLSKDHRYHDLKTQFKLLLSFIVYLFVYVYKYLFFS